VSSFEPWVRSFLSEGTRTASLAVVRRDGSPHVKPVWFLLDGEDLVFTTGRETVAGKALRRDGRVALSVDDPMPPFSFALVRGSVVLSEEPAPLRRWAGRIGARYMGGDREEEYAARNGVPGELLVRVQVEQVVAARDIAE